jgi:hypothetical protein
MLLRSAFLMQTQRRMTTTHIIPAMMPIRAGVGRLLEESGEEGYCLAERLGCDGRRTFRGWFGCGGMLMVG